MKNQNKNILDSNRIGNLLIKLSLPMFFGMAVQAVYSIVDTIFIGHYVGMLGIASLSIVFPLQMFTVGIGSMIGIGGGSLISRLIGRGDQKSAEHTLGNSISLSVLFSILIMAGILPFIDFWANLVGASENVLPYARGFLFIIFSGTIFNIANTVLLYMVRAEGNTRVTMISMILQSVLNIILDAVFIIYFKMGMNGAALATVLSQVISVIYILSFYFSKSSYLKIKTANLYPDRNILKSIFAIGISQFAQSIANSLSAIFIIRMASGFGGDTALSAFGIIQRVMWFSSIPCMVLGQGMQPILGFNYGAKRYHQAIKVIKLATFISVACSTVAFIVLFIFPEPVIRIFTGDISLINATAFAARRVFLVLPLFGFFAVGQLVFPSVGKAKESFIIAITRPLVFITPLVLILPHFFQLDGVWLAFPGSDTLSFLLNIAMLIPLFREFRKAALNTTLIPDDPLSSNDILENKEPTGVAK
jgi:putative MATE family efflux protein